MSPEREKKSKSVIASPNNTPYLIAIVAMAIITIAGSIVISVLRPDSDIIIVFGLMTGFMTPTTLSLLALMKAQETHLSVNSRLDEFIQNAKASSRAEGVEEGRQKEKKDR